MKAENNRMGLYSKLFAGTYHKNLVIHKKKKKKSGEFRSFSFHEKWAQIDKRYYY
jgi:hypothetical protein